MKTSRLIIMLLLLVSSCSSRTKMEIDAKKRQIEEINSREELQSKTDDLINKSSNLTDAQKGDFLLLHKKVIEDVDQINKEMSKLKIILFKSLTDEKFDRPKVAELQKQLKKLYDNKYKIMMRAMTDAREILGVEFTRLYPLDDYRHQIYDKYR